MQAERPLLPKIGGKSPVIIVDTSGPAGDHLMFIKATPHMDSPPTETTLQAYRVQLLTYLRLSSRFLARFLRAFSCESYGFASSLLNC
eukprot:1533856-Amphidinium_carterae.1